MKKILSLILVLSMIMAMTIPAFAASANEIHPYAACNGNHTYGVVHEEISYSCSASGNCMKTTIKYYKCANCTSNYVGSPSTVVVNHKYVEIGETNTGATVFRCSRCNNVITVN